ncbi:hypothetical protein IVB16_31785 [Bradyrhizobium sp. 183]|uniref:hypothetical protein n=1 Tax=unclassified Bradyrhizobium TaxID=2631580 RepID=UPI001FFF2DB2|nr:MULTISPECIES: hypothetical protein [unclassified Bradyrhizobium]UPJ79300.1 hypothetical protein IVB17_31785 [Bradyrhizobium sp. 184]UPJ87094.1 hypothetical protein IVB16_31785 [Bradyrhizobium sp. 183]
MALLSDSIPPKDIYPLNVDGAFKAFDRIKSNVVWAGTITQMTSLLQTGEADFGAVFGNRVKATTQPGRAGSLGLAQNYHAQFFGDP